MSDKKPFDPHEMTLGQLLQQCRPPEGNTNAVPIVINPDGEYGECMVVIQGHRKTASIILSKIMELVDDLHDIADQQANMAAPGKGKEKSEDGTRIIVPRP